MANFQLTNKRLLQVTLNNEKVLSRTGAMVAYDGNIKFEKSVTGGEGFFGAVKRRLAGESLDMMTAGGTGVVYFARNAIEIKLLRLQNEKIFIESSSLLALETSLRTNVAFAGLRGATTGQGLFTTTVEGVGQAAVISHGGIIMLEVTPGTPLCVDPDAFVAYKGQLTQEFIFDVNWKTLIGQTSGESFQLKFSGAGVVYIQPSERK